MAIALLINLAAFAYFWNAQQGGPMSLLLVGLFAGILLTIGAQLFMSGAHVPEQEWDGRERRNNDSEDDAA